MTGNGTIQVSDVRLINESLRFGGTVTDVFFRPFPPRSTYEVPTVVGPVGTEKPGGSVARCV